MKRKITQVVAGNEDEEVKDDNKRQKIDDKRSLGRKNEVVIASWTKGDQVKFWETYKVNMSTTSNLKEPYPTDDCHLWTGSTQNGYPSVSQGHGKSKVKMHILSACIRYSSVPTEGQVVSHLCHRKLCINPNHLVIESIMVNNSRKGCLCSFKDGKGVLWCLCPHNPRCLRSDTENNNNFKPYALEIDLSSPPGSQQPASQQLASQQAASQQLDQMSDSQQSASQE